MRFILLIIVISFLLMYTWFYFTTGHDNEAELLMVSATSVITGACLAASMFYSTY